MSRVYIGMDMASGSDYSAVTIMARRNIRWYHHLLKRLHLIKHLWEYKILESYTVPPINQALQATLHSNKGSVNNVKRLRGEG